MCGGVRRENQMIRCRAGGCRMRIKRVWIKMKQIKTKQIKVKLMKRIQKIMEEKTDEQAA